MNKSPDFELLHHDMYPVVMKYAKRFVESTGYRLALRMVQHKADGSIIATDGHRLIKVDGMHGFKEEWMINPHTLEFAKGKYPDISKIIPDLKPTTLTLSNNHVSKWIQLHKGLKAMTKSKREALEMSFGEKSITARSRSLGLSLELPFDSYSDGDKTETVVYNTIYMLDALELLEAMKSDKVNVRFYGKLSPFMLDNGKETTCLILPVRIN